MYICIYGGPSMQTEGAKSVGDSVEEEVAAADEEASTGGGGGRLIAEGGHSRSVGLRHGDPVALGQLALEAVGPE